MKRTVFCLLLSCAFAVSATEENLLKNGSFETLNDKGFPKGWNVPKNAKVISDAAAGKRALRYNGTISNWHFAMPPGQYTIRFQARKDNNKWLGVGIICADKKGKRINNKNLSKYFGVGKTFPDWTQLEFQTEIPENTNGKSYIVIGTHGGVMDIDAIQIVKIDASKTDGVLVFQDNFERKDLGKDYITEAGKWEIRNGAMYAKTAETFSLVKFARPLGKNLRLEYTCYSRSPEDMSALLAALPEKKGLNGFAFGFAALYNSYNYIAATNPFTLLTRTTAEGFCTGAMPSKKHRIIVEKREGDLKMFRDGKLELAAHDAFADDKSGKSFGFYTYNTAYFDDIKVYRLPEAKRSSLKPEYPVKEVIFIDKFDKKSDFTGRNAKQILVQTWEYEKTKAKNQYLVQDPCLEASDVTLKLPKTENGLVEFDILAKDHKEIFVDLVDAKGKTAASFIIDKKGMFQAEGQNGRIPLLNEIAYRRRSVYDTLAIHPQKWYTFRIKYNPADRMIDNFALIEYYTEQNGFDRDQAIKQGDYISLGGKLPMKKDTGTPVAVRFRTADGTFCLDNYLAFGPVGFKSVKGKSILYSGTKLLSLKHQKRRDPMLLKVQSLRNLDNTNSFRTPTHLEYGYGKGKTTFQEFGKKYNELMLSMAFVFECIQIMERQNFYKGKAITLADLRKEFLQAEVLQEQTLIAFANAFWNKQDDTMLNKQAIPALHKFEAAYSAIRKKVLAMNPAMKQIPAVPIYHQWNLKYDRSMKRWVDEKGNPQAFFSSTPQAQRSHIDGYAATEYILNKVRAIGIQPATSTIKGLTGNPKDGEYYDGSWFQRSVENSRTLKDKHNLNPCGLTTLGVGVGPMRFNVPKWWFDKNKTDKDIFYSFPDGTPGDKVTRIAWGWPKMAFLALNFWNEKVQEYLHTRHRLIGEALGKHKDLYDNMLIYFGGEATLSPGNGMLPGYAKSAIRAFRNRLQKQYGTIQNLNKKWETSYTSFGEIKPPLPGTEPSPLRYEFNMFVNEDYFNIFLGGVKRSLEQGYGKSLAIGHDMQDTFSFFDMPAYFDNVSIALFHSYAVWDRKIYPKYLRSLSEATGVPWGAMEWGSPQGSKTMFDMAEERIHVTQDLCHQLMSGCVAPNLFSEQMYAGTSDWQYGFTPNDHRIGFLAFNYHVAPALRISKDRGMRFGEIALRAKSITPDIAVLEVDSSRRNALPDRSIYNMCKDFAMEMENQAAHYGVLFEKLVIDGRQKLNNIPLIFVPNGICMKESLDKKLEEYLQNGGTVIAFAPPGVYNEYAKAKSGGLLNKTFPGVKWTHSNYATWYANGKTQTCWAGKLGKGTIYIFNTPGNFNGNAEKFRAIMKKHIVPKILCSDNMIQYSYLEYKGVRYLYVLNSSITDTKVTELSLSGKYSIEDIGMPNSLKVPSVCKNGRTIFNVRLAPAEMTLFKLSK